MKRLLTLLLTISLLTAYSCKEEKKAEGPTQMEQVMAVHDEVMPKMSTISSLVGKLKPIADTTAADSEYHKAMTDLQDAHKSMMDWMKGFGERFDSDEILKGKALTSEKQQWLDEEEAKVKAMRDQVNASIEAAQKLLEQ